MASKAILVVGFYRFLLPDAAQAAKALDILSKGLQCEERFGEKDTDEIKQETVDLEIKVVPAKARFRKPKEEGGEKVDVFVAKPTPRLKAGSPTKRLNGQRTLFLGDGR